jgi:hypothetical protein
MSTVPPEFTIVCSLVSLALGALGAFALLKRGDIARHRLIHSLHHLEKHDENYNWLRRRGLATLIYVVPPHLTGRIIISVPHIVFNPGRLAIKDVSVLVRYPSRFGLSDQALDEWSPKDAAEYKKRRNCQVSSDGVQVLINHSILRRGEMATIHDYMVLPSISAIRFLQQENPSLTERLKAIPGFRDYASLGISIFSEKTPARNFAIDLIVVNGAAGETEEHSTLNAMGNRIEIRELHSSKIDFEAMVDAMLRAAGGRSVRAGLYLKSPLAGDPYKQALAFVVGPQFGKIPSKDGPIYVADSDTGEFGSFIYWTTAVDYKTIPSSLTEQQLERYLGLRAVPTERFAKFRPARIAQSARKYCAYIRGKSA